MASKPPSQQNGMPPRTRRASLSGGIGTGRHKTVAPSPLSQSTSAIHLQSHHPPTIDPNSIGVPRRLSKRRKPFQGLFGDGTQSQPQSATTPTSDGPHTLKKQSSKRSSTSGSRPSFSAYRPLVRSQTTQSPAEKKEKRGSILGRFVRKLSVIRRSDPVIATSRISFQAGRQSQSQSAEPADRKSARTSTSLPEKNRQSKATVTSPTTTESETSADPPVSRTSVHAAETRSSMSVDIEASMTLGKLTIANPDAPSAATTPAKTEEPLPANDADTLSQHTLRPAAEIPQSPQPAPEPPREPTRTPPPRESQIRNSIPQVQAQPDPEPEPEEEDDPPPPVPSKSPFFARLHLASIPAESMLSLPGVIPTIPTEGTPSITNSPLEERFDPHPFSMSPSPPTTTLRQPPSSPPTPTPAPTRIQRSAYTPELTNDSPLSRASLCVNPGTPYVASNTVAAQPRTTEIIKAQPAEPSSQRLKNSTSSKSRETETFRLVRSYSGPDTERQQTFLADGAHWEVENTDQKRKDANGTSRSSRYKAPGREASGEERYHGRKENTDDRYHKRESADDRRRERESTDDRRREREDADDRRRERESADDSRRERESADDRRRERENADDRHHKREGTDERSQRKETAEDRHYRRESRRPDGVRERDRDREREDRKSRREKSSRDSHTRQESREKRRTSQVTSTSSSSSAPMRASVAEPYRRSDYANPARRSTVSSQQSFPREHDHERKASVSSRPTSEVPPTQALNDVRAREAWEMDRIWKGRSMSINQEGSNVIASPMSTGGDLDGRDDLYHHSATHGSSRTYFVVQTPIQNQHSSGQQNGVAFPSTSPPTTNGSQHRTPPPEPIRPAQYQFQPLPQSLRALDDPASREYWAKLAGVSTASQ